MLNIVPTVYTHLDLGAGSEASTQFWENRSLPPSRAVTLHSGKPLWNHFGIPASSRATCPHRR